MKLIMNIEVYMDRVSVLMGDKFTRNMYWEGFPSLILKEFDKEIFEKEIWDGIKDLVGDVPINGEGAMMVLRRTQEVFKKYLDKKVD